MSCVNFFVSAVQAQKDVTGSTKQMKVSSVLRYKKVINKVIINEKKKNSNENKFSMYGTQCTLLLNSLLSPYKLFASCLKGNLN